MKLSPLSTPLFVLVATLAKGIQAYSFPFPGFHVESRKLDEDSGHSGNIASFLVSNIREDEAWCITAIEGTDFGNVNLRLCDFEGAPTNQLWYPGYPNKIHSALEPGKCLVVNHGRRLFSSARIHVADCDSGLSEFFYDGFGHIKVAEDDSYCLTNRGPNPNASDYIHVKKCIDRPAFHWDAMPYFFIQLKSGGGCAQPRGETDRIILDDCKDELAWRVEWGFLKDDGDFDGFYFLLHSKVDDALCLRAGQGDVAGDGTHMRLAPCDRTDVQQQFHSLLELLFNNPNGTIQVNNERHLCMVYHGVTPHIGKDPIILKTCNEKQETWEVATIGPFF
jgi:hypothetical protein